MTEPTATSVRAAVYGLTVPASSPVPLAPCRGGAA